MANWKAVQHSQLGDKERLILEEKEEEIVELMDPLRVTRLLVDAGVIDEDDRKKIIHLINDEDQKRALIGMLPKRGKDAFDVFVKVLKESGTDNHTLLARILRNESSPRQAHDTIEENQYAELKEGHENHEIRIQSLENADRGDLQREVNDLRAQIELKNKELAELREQNEKYEEKIKCLEKEVRTLNDTLEKQEGKIRILEEAAENDRRRQEGLAEEIRAVKEDASKDREDIARIIKDLQIDAATKNGAKAPAPKKRQPSAAIIPANRFDKPESPRRPAPLKKGGGPKNK